MRRRIQPALLFGEAIDQPVEEQPHLGAQLPAMRVERDNLHLRSPVIGQQRHQRSGSEQIGNDKGRAHPQPEPDNGDQIARTRTATGFPAGSMKGNSPPKVE